MLPYDFEGVVHGCPALSWLLSTLPPDWHHSRRSAPSWLLGSFMASWLPPDGVFHINRELWRDVGTEALILRRWPCPESCNTRRELSLPLRRRRSCCALAATGRRAVIRLWCSTLIAWSCTGCPAPSYLRSPHCFSSSWSHVSLLVARWPFVSL